MKPNRLAHGPPGHPVHPPLTDATVGVYTFAAIAGVLSVLGVAETQFAHGWWLALVVGLVLAAPTAATGWLDFFTLEPGSRRRRAALRHGLTMVAANVVFGLAAILGHGAYADSEVTALPLLLTLAGLAVLGVGGLLGGSLVFVHGVRVLGAADEHARTAESPPGTGREPERG